jgi:transposase
VLRARIVLAAALGEQNTQIAGRLGIAPNTALKWRKRFFLEGLAGLADRGRPGRPLAFPPAVIAEVKAIACELPAMRAVPLSRFSVADVREEVIACGLVEQVSVSTVWRWLDEDALKPWRHRSWIFPRAPDFAAKAGVVPGLYQRWFGGERLGPAEFVLSADERTSIQARCRRHPTRPPASARAMRAGHEYERGGALAYLVARDVGQARLFGRCEPTTGIAPFGRPAGQVMGSEPYPSAARCSGWPATAAPIGGRPRSTGWRGTGRLCAWCTCRSTPPG